MATIKRRGCRRLAVALPLIVVFAESEADVSSATVLSEDGDACHCNKAWESVRAELWHLFRSDFDLAKLMDCITLHPGTCEDGVQFDLLYRTLTCSDNLLPTVDRRMCPAGMMHYMVICSIQMWLKGHYRQSALYYEHVLGYLALALECLEGSNWPLWPGQVLRNYRTFIAAAFPPGRLRAEKRFAENNTEYTIAGPVVDPTAWRWWSGPRTGLYCPPSPEPLGIGVGVPRTSVLCAVPLVWPGERSAAEIAAQSFGRNCDEMVFFLAASNTAIAQEAKTALRRFGSHIYVHDLAEEFPDMVRDNDAVLYAQGRRGLSGANQKDLLMFAHLADRGNEKPTHWVCRVETDSYFAPPNFRRFVSGGNAEGKIYNSSEPWFLGTVSYWHIHFEPRIIFNEQVQCLSAAAVKKLGVEVRAAPRVEKATYLQCEVAPGHRGDLMLALCLNQAGIQPYPVVADRWGREYFLNYRLEDLPAYQPDPAYGTDVDDPRSLDTNTAIHWRGKADIFMPCLMVRRNQSWVSPFPISFHDYKRPEGIRWVHEVMLGQRACHLCPVGYHPRWAQDFE